MSKPLLIIDFNIVYEYSVKIDVDQPDEAEEKLRRVTDLLRDLTLLLTQKT